MSIDVNPLQIIISITFQVLIIEVKRVTLLSHNVNFFYTFRAVKYNSL